MKKITTRVLAAALAFSPALAMAQGFGSNGVIGLLDAAGYLVGRLLPFIVALTVLVFLWGIFKYVLAGGDPDKRSEAKGYIIWGIIGLAVMISVSGLVNFLSRTFGLDNSPLQPPNVSNLIVR
jgi:ribose/xylose/arabinose/galactoside ABC-type transport system permease subunit